MKQLRILTGRHAGARINLTATRHQIGADEAADIQLLDWTAEPVVIGAGEDGMVHIATASQGGQASAVLADFTPRRFGDVVLCTGPADATWPADADIIARLSPAVVAAPPAAPAKIRSVWPRVTSAVVGTALMTAALSAAVAPLSQNQAERKALTSVLPPEPLKMRVERALAETSVAGYEVAQQGDGVVVRGLLRQPSDADALRQRLAAFQGDRIVQSFASATEVAQSIADALGQPGLRITHHGNGLFTVTGEVADLPALRQNATRVATDLAPLVRGIDVAATQRPPTSPPAMSALMETDGLQYMQTRDGVKHLSLTSGSRIASADQPASFR
ncbi:HrpD5 family protein [Paracidovorax citrulli]|uniref:HrpD5 family protein n=1 Tax=Paracidovorax citrulli TaxID=80869 RepID=UPI00066248CB|nr:HrpD5 family protein [Paracidovorax citrulli]QCX11157.1 HrpD5 [Paracidovorax citrulli]UEG45871.1 secretion protein [Paracidovorax citrulli]UMT86833.1 secretion protein [Paracidovorax citrulli]UMT94874.1 secretion protein [Paracidovorax citrulli]WIY34326.1 HrpD5 family protein [Paracidovorax citrulli]